MKTKNLTKEFLINMINRLTKDMRQAYFTILTCETLIRKLKSNLNNSKQEHDELWIWRDRLKKAIKNKRELENELKMYQKIYTKKCNYQEPKAKTYTYYCYSEY